MVSVKPFYFLQKINYTVKMSKLLNTNNIPIQKNLFPISKKKKFLLF